MSHGFSCCMVHWRRLLRICFGGLLLLALGACQSLTLPPASPLPTTTTTVGGEVLVPFQTLAFQETSGGYEGQEPLLPLIKQPEEIVPIEDWLTPEDSAALKKVDFATEQVIALFRGRKPTSNYQTVIERITRQADHLIVYAQFWEPSPQWASTTAETSPYHLVTISKEALQTSAVELVLRSIVLTPTPPAP